MPRVAAERAVAVMCRRHAKFVRGGISREQVAAGSDSWEGQFTQASPCGYTLEVSGMAWATMIRAVSGEGAGDASAWVQNEDGVVEGEIEINYRVN
jgi:hypothetical protein